MDLEQLANLGEALGGLAVLGSLIYLIFEVRRNTRTAQGAAGAQSIEAFSSINKMLVQQPDLAQLLERAMDTECDVSRFSSEDKAQLILMFRMIFQQFEAQFFLHKSGVLPDELWENRRGWANSFLELPAWKDWWAVESQTPGYTPGFIDNVLSAPAFSLDNYHRFSE
ncbi:MAG: hypothetical protein ACR2PZ_16385 [Pseudomonadales bacterium]